MILSEASNRRKGGVRLKRIGTDDTAIGIEDVRTRGLSDSCQVLNSYRGRNSLAPCL